MVGVDAEEAEGKRGVKPLLVRPLGTRKRERHVLDVLACRCCRAAEDRRGARVVDALAHVPYGRLVFAEECAQIPARLGERREAAVAKLQERERGAAIGEDEDVVLYQLLSDVDDGALVDDARVVAADHVDDAADLAALQRFCNRAESLVALADGFGTEADLRRDLVGGDKDGHVAPRGEAFDGARDDLACDLLCVGDIRVMVVVGVVLRAGETSRIARRDDGRLEAARHVHNGGEDILHVGDPEIERPRAEHELCADGVRERDDAFVAVHGGEARTADAVELDALCAVLFREVDEFLRAADAHDLADERRQVAVHGDVDPAFLECADVDLRGRAMTDAEERVGRDVGGDDARVAEGEAAAQELLHDALPIAVRAAARAVEGIEDLVVGADRQNVELLPDLFSFGGGECSDGAILFGQGAGEIGEQHVGKAAREAARALTARIDAEGTADLADALFSEKRQFELAFGGELQRQQHFARVCAVLGDAARSAPKEVARDDEVGIGAADAARALRRDLARPHVAVLAADAGEAEGTLRLLLIKAVKRRIAADLFHVQQHLAHGGIGRLVEHILLRGERLAVGGNRLHIVVDAAVRVRMRRVVRMRLPGRVRVVVIMIMCMLMVVRVAMRLFVVVAMVVAVRVLVAVSRLLHVGAPFLQKLLFIHV